MSALPHAIAPVVCPHCQASNPGDAPFCEVCGYDFTTGQAPPAEAQPILPAPPAQPVLSGWTVEVTADADWYESQKNDDSDPFPSTPTVRVVELPQHVALVGRTSSSRNIHPEIDAGDDTAVSRRHAQFVQQAAGWSIVDLQSTNGTHVAKRGEPVQPDSLVGGVPQHWTTATASSSVSGRGSRFTHRRRSRSFAGRKCCKFCNFVTASRPCVRGGCRGDHPSAEGGAEFGGIGDASGADFCEFGVAQRVVARLQTDAVSKTP